MIEPKEILGPEEFYDNMAPYYDSFIENTRYNILSLKEEKEFVESFIKDKKTILDLGCGTGRTMKLLSGVNKELVGVDISRKMLDIARNNGLDVIQASALDLPFNSDCYNAIYSIHGGFGYCKDIDEVGKLSLELYRVLKQEGLILLDTPHGVVRGAQYIFSWPVGGRMINTVGYGEGKDEILKVLDGVGFSQILFFGGYEVDVELHGGSRRIIVCATKDVGLTK